MKIFSLIFLSLNLFAIENLYSEYINKNALFKSCKNFKSELFEKRKIENIDIYAHRDLGFFALKPQSKSKLILQIPHAFYDLFTKEIGFKLFKELDIFAIALNTKSRRIFDLTHNKKSCFNDFTDRFREFHFAQLHGFKERGENIDIILSDSTKFPSKWIKKLNSCFKKRGFNSKLYPIEIDYLGGLKNAQARVLRKYQNFNFAHIELSRSFRERLLKNELKEFAKCLEVLY